jgi:hypothetical protein
MEFVQHLLTEAAATPTLTPSGMPVPSGASTGTTILTILGGAVGAALLGLLGAWIGRRGEHAKWVREERLKAYLGIVEMFHANTVELDTIRLAFANGESPSTEGLKAQFASYAAYYAPFDVLGPYYMADLADEFRDALHAPDIDRRTTPAEDKRISDAQRAFTDAARKVLGVKEK